MNIRLFDFHLPESAIAQVPADRRDESRLLLVNRSTGQVAQHMFRDLPDLLPENIRCFRNNVSVLKARLFAERSGGGMAEILLLRPDAKLPLTRWWALLRPGKKLPVGAAFALQGAFVATVLQKHEDGTALLDFALEGGYPSVTAMADAKGVMPLPPYIKRDPNDERQQLDAVRYQTVYADPQKPFAVAAPTAGLHFTPPVIERMEQRGAQFHDLTLHVGLGTFRPIQTDNVEDHKMHDEFYEMPASTVTALQAHDRRLKLAIGTTSLRAMEDFHRSIRRSGSPSDGGFARSADIFIYPPDVFSTDVLVTNFHLPRSSLLCLVAAFLTPGSTDGISWLRDIYSSAIKRKFRFYSYGDAMLII